MQSMEMDDRGLYGIYPEWHIPFWQTKFFYWCLLGTGILLALGFIFLIVRFILKRRQKPMQTPWEYALEKCASLELFPCNSKADGKHLYGTLSYVMKQYVHRRYSYDVRWKTDEELITFLEQHEFPEHLLADIREIMIGSTLVKFANIEVIQEQAKRHLILSKSFIQKTIPQEQRSEI